MNIELFTVGKTRQEYIKDGVEIYLKRLRRYVPFELREFPDIKNAGKMSENEQKEAEGEMLLSKITPADHVILLDERGQEYTSKKFATKLRQIMLTGKKRLIFVVGGPYGFSEVMYSRANELLSFSRMTFNHEMIRLFMVEQTYRAMTILRGEPYHHE